jgi:hypothetical protein
MTSDPVPAVEQAEALLKQRLRGRVSCLRVLIREKGVVLQGRTFTYYVKQLAQHAAMQTLGLPILANEIEVGGDPRTFGTEAP